MIPIIPVVIIGIMVVDVAHRVYSTHKLVKLETERNKELKKVSNSTVV